VCCMWAGRRKGRCERCERCERCRGMRVNIYSSALWQVGQASRLWGPVAGGAGFKGGHAAE